MKILGLPGIRPATFQWMQKLIAALDLGQTEISVQQYRCWSGGPGAQLNLNEEAAFAARGNPDLVIAKSVGTRVALHAYVNRLLLADSYIFLGTPVNNFAGKEIESLKYMCNAARILLIQQKQDPTGDFMKLSSCLPIAPLCVHTEIPGNDHAYANTTLLKQLVESWYVVPATR